MEYLNDILEGFQSRLADIERIDGINAGIIKIFQQNLDTIHSEIQQTGKFGGLLKKVDRYKQTLDDVSKLDEMKSDFEILREQRVVLLVSAFEVFIEDIFRAIANNSPEYFIWPEKDKKIVIGVEDFTSRFTLGDAIITHLNNKQYSFQDLGSTVKAFQDYLGVDLEIEDDTKDSIILGTACRHLIVHKGSVIDRQFLSQTRSLDAKYVEGKTLSISEEDVAQLQQHFSLLAEKMVLAIYNRDSSE